VKPYYDDGTVTIYHGDCRDVLSAIAADVLVSDPPYGLDAPLNSGGRRGRITPKEMRVVPDWDQDLAVRDAILELWSPKPAVVFASVTKPRPAGATQRPLIWDKGEAVGMGDTDYPWRPNYELIWTIGRGFHGPRTSSVLRYPITPGHRDHPTEKPVGLMINLLLKCPPGVVLDPFMGSGTTLRAAKDLGRRAIGIEIEERYCEIAARRCAQDVLDFGEAA
jgi:DNA modification methylase